MLSRLWDKDYSLKIVVGASLLIFLFGAPGAIAGDDGSDESGDAFSELSPEVQKIFDRIYTAERQQWTTISDLRLNSRLSERRVDGDGKVKEDKSFDKVVYFRVREDSVWKFDVHERYLQYFKNGEMQGEKKLKEEVKEKREKIKDGQEDNKREPITNVFLPRYRKFYTYTFNGVADTLINGRTCYVIEVFARDIENDEKSRIDGVFYIDTLTARPVHVNFSPTKLAGNLVFKLKEIHMTLDFAQMSEDIWYPERFYLYGKATAGFLFPIRFEVEERFFDPRVNSGLADSVFNQRIIVASATNSSPVVE